MRTNGSRTVATRVLIGTDDVEFAEWLRVLLESQCQAEVVGITRRGDVVASLADELRPDAVLLEAQLTGVDALEAAHRIRLAGLNTAIVVFCVDGLPQALASFAGDVDAYVQKADAQTSLPALVRLILRLSRRADPTGSSAGRAQDAVARC